jgi:hypothetical protein
VFFFFFFFFFFNYDVGFVIKFFKLCFIYVLGDEMKIKFDVRRVREEGWLAPLTCSRFPKRTLLRGPLWTQ